MRRNGRWTVVIDKTEGARRRSFCVGVRCSVVGSDPGADVGIRTRGFPPFACGFRLERGEPWFHRFGGLAEVKGEAVESVALKVGDVITVAGVDFSVVRKQSQDRGRAGDSSAA